MLLPAAITWWLSTIPENKIGKCIDVILRCSLTYDARNIASWQMEDRTSTSQKGPPFEKNGGLRDRVDSVL